MKKYFFTMATLALFAIGFAASDDEESSSSSNSSTQTEQKEETEVERHAREEKEKQEQVQKKKDEVAQKGYEHGYQRGFSDGPEFYSVNSQNARGMAKTWYSQYYGGPMTDEEKELCNAYVDKFVEGYFEGHKAREE